MRSGKKLDRYETLRDAHELLLIHFYRGVNKGVCKFGTLLELATDKLALPDAKLEPDYIQRARNLS